MVSPLHYDLEVATQFELGWRFFTEKVLTYLFQQVRKNKFIEILPINVGCLGACTYCKTKHARGHLGSYTVDGLVSTFTWV